LPSRAFHSFPLFVPSAFRPLGFLLALPAGYDIHDAMCQPSVRGVVLAVEGVKAHAMLSELSGKKLGVDPSGEAVPILVQRQRALRQVL
jgi:hypothetical protein